MNVREEKIQELERKGTLEIANIGFNCVGGIEINT